MFKKIALAAVVLVAAVLLFAATRPDSIRVQRSTSIKAAPEKIFPLIADFHAWSAWSPWEKLDPAMKRTHSGAPSGKGAAYAWDGNNDVGAGRMEIAEVGPPSRITIKRDFSRPMEGHNTAEFTLVPKGDASEVTWTMVGPSPYLSKLIGLFLDMDKMIGKDFEAGLANLKALAEK